ncbi:MAG: hypothetical protein IPJ06_05310 [Saprospiraceae bacterium]|nr:hypothetical protein [Saprospiraceae bacterium]
MAHALIRILTRTWLALDNCDNPASHVQKVTVRDTKAPIFLTTPTDLTVNCDEVPPLFTRKWMTIVIQMFW